jgi:hypothetical protein
MLIPPLTAPADAPTDFGGEQAQPETDQGKHRF